MALRVARHVHSACAAVGPERAGAVKEAQMPVPVDPDLIEASRYSPTLEARRRGASAQWPGGRYLTVFLAALSISSGVISTTVFTVAVLP